MPCQELGRTRGRQPSAASAQHSTARCNILRLGLSMALLIAVQSSPAKAQTPLVERGLALSKLHCARCHIVSESDRFTGTSSTPSFKIMIEFLKDWEERFGSFMARNPHPAHIRLDGDDPRPEHLPATIREVILSLDDIEAILAYVDQMAVELGRKQPED